MRCAASTACVMPRTVFSMLTTTPRRRPSDGASPTPTMFNRRSVGSPTTQQILVVPISSAVTYLDRGKNLSWNVGWNRRAHYRGVRPSRQHKLASFPQASAVPLEQVPPNDRQVVEDADTEGDDGGEVELDAELVAQVGERPGGKGVDDQPGDEHLVLEVSVQPGFDRTQHRVQRGEDHDRGVARVARRDLHRGIEAQDDAENAENDHGRNQPESFARAGGRQPHFRPRICTAGAPGFSRLMYWICAEVKSIRLLSDRKAANFGSRLARSSLVTIWPKMMVHPWSVCAVSTWRRSSWNDISEILNAGAKPAFSWSSIGSRSRSTAR